MSKEQIDAIYEDLVEIFDEEYNKRNLITPQNTAEKLNAKGYRKASEVTLEVIGEVEKIIDKYYNRHIFGVEDLSDVEKEAVMNFSDDITGDLAELKKKHAEEK